MKVGILGADGRMGQLIRREIASKKYGAAVIGALLGHRDDKEPAFKSCDVMIDFTSPEACAEHAILAAKYQRALVVGTTGLQGAEGTALLEASKRAPILYGANMSLGANLLISLVEQVAAKLNDDFDIEIFEAHHRDKADAPSGTALALGRTAARSRGVNFDDVAIYNRFGATGVRKTGAIGMSVFRGGDIIGDHTVSFAGLGERLELTHKASDRAIFAKGAVRAALWLKDQPPGFYSMKDVISGTGA
jgi:4-hydroxy-tetrahydrodipicolinate reductase